MEVGDGCTLRDEEREGTSKSPLFFFDESVVAADDSSSIALEVRSRWSGLWLRRASVATLMSVIARWQARADNEFQCAQKQRW